MKQISGEICESISPFVSQAKEDFRQKFEEVKQLYNDCQQIQYISTDKVTQYFFQTP